ncbi:MAG: hypothetical protein U0324_17730 [Polyangiales bacterium]
MPVPVLIYIGAAALAALTGGGVVFRHRILRVFKGRPLVVLGAHKVGKTVLLSFLTKGKVISPHDGYKRTEAAQRLGRGHHVANGEDENLYVKDVHDVPGAEDDVGTWRALFFKAARNPKSLCFYLVDAERLHADDEDHVGRVKVDLDRISEWLEGPPRRRAPRLFVIATHFDKIPGWKNGSEKDRAAIERRFKKHDALQGALDRRDPILVADLSGRKEGFESLFDRICGILEALED